jgi:D-sedoheptulose 7-phosphate isomerase
MGMKTIALVGENRASIAPVSDHVLGAPSRRTPLIQQVHLCLYHYLCMRIEERMLEAQP